MRPEHWLYTIPLRLRSVFRRAQAYQELDDELRDHLEQKIEEYAAQGMTREQARRCARLDLEGFEQTKEKCRDTRRVNWIHDVFQDTRYGFRVLRKSPAFTIVVILILALGIGANTAVFSILFGLMLRPLPVRDPGRLVELLHQYPGEPAFNGFSWDAYRTVRDGNHVFSDLFIGSVNFTTVRSDDLQPQTVFVGNIGGTFFQSLGVQPAAGRLIGPEDMREGVHAPVAVASWSFWKSRFDLDPAIVGKKIIVDDAPVTIIGVAQRGFYGLSEQAKQDLWQPMSLGPSQGWGIGLLAHLKPGVSMEQAQSEMAVLFHSVTEAPDAGPFVSKMKLRLEPAGHGVYTPLQAMLSTPLIILMVMVGLLLLLACANLAGLLLARAASRHHEMAVRVCLGAGRSRLIRQTLTESLLLSIAGSALGTVLAYFGTRGLIRIFASGRHIAGLPVDFDSLNHPDWHMLLFTGATAILTALLFGAAPALGAYRPIPTQPLQAGTRISESKSQRLFGKSLVVSQVALSVVLLTSAALFVNYLSHLRSLNPGFRRDHLLLATLDTAHNGYNAAQFARLCEQLIAQLKAIPGVNSAALSEVSPMQGPGAGASAFAEGHPDNHHDVSINNVAPGYFETYDTPLLAGRSFTREDQEKPLVAVINQTAARDCFGDENPIGKHLTLSHITLTQGDFTYEVVGVVTDAKYNDIEQPAPPTIYRDTVQNGTIPSQLAVRTSLAPDAVAAAVRETSSAVLKTVPIVRITTMDTQIDATIVPERLIAMLSGWFGALGALLAAIGLYGLLAYTVTRRTHEIGVRVALGATRSDVTRIVLRDAFWLVCAGFALGIPLAVWAKSVAASLIRGLPSNSPVSIVFGGAVMIALGLASAYIPARRAARVDPMVALRYE